MSRSAFCVRFVFTVICLDDLFVVYSWPGTNEIRRLVRCARALVARLLRERANWACASGRKVLSDARVKRRATGKRRGAICVGGDDFIGRNAVLNPRGDCP